MQYPSTLIQSFGTAAAFAEVASVHQHAPEGRALTRDSVYMWKVRNAVPHMWRPVIRAMVAEKTAAGMENLTRRDRQKPHSEASQ